MNQRDTALASLWDRTYRAAVTLDPRVLLDERALADARNLVAATDPVTDIHAARVLGWFRWLRYLALPDHDADQELSAAIGLLKPVFEQNPYAVPEPLQRWYLQTEANSYASHHRPTAGSADQQQAPWSGVERLPVFHAAVRSTIRSAPANQPYRARFLLDAALMLRSIAGRGADEAVLAEAAELTLAALGTGPAAIPPQTYVLLSVTPQAFLEPVERNAANPAGPSWQAEATQPQRPIADSAAPAASLAYGGRQPGDHAGHPPGRHQPGATRSRPAPRGT